MTDATDFKLFTILNAEKRQEKLSFVPISSEGNAYYGSYQRQREI